MTLGIFRYILPSSGPKPGNFPLFYISKAPKTYLKQEVAIILPSPENTTGCCPCQSFVRNQGNTLPDFIDEMMNTSPDFKDHRSPQTFLEGSESDEISFFLV